ncbi:MAG: hypothetical protein KGL02_00820 [Acidobacteriota bacterium]|nr:hypothetical protein [Acidobacteriota bacterium]MDE3171161.1 hypothetical protein [Acidobacteriota bacterium]
MRVQVAQVRRKSQAAALREAKSKYFLDKIGVPWKIPVAVKAAGVADN